MRDRGLLEVVGARGTSVLEPYFQSSGKNIPLKNLKWELLEYWIPVAHMTVDGVRFDPETGLYSTLQDSQDEYQKKPFLTYDNVLCWRAMLDLAALFERLRDTASAHEMTQRAQALRKAIMQYSISDKAPGSAGSIFACATDGKNPLFADVPPGSLMKLPALGFVSENDPVFIRSYEWLHSKSYKYSYADRPYGLPGSYRLPITTSWTIADHLALNRGREQALKIMRASSWDSGIISEGSTPTQQRWITRAVHSPRQQDT